MAGGARNGKSHDDIEAVAHGRGRQVADPELVRLLHDRITRIEDQTAEERRDATKQRHDFRAEVQLSINGMQTEMRSGFGSIASSISKLHDRLNETTKEAHRAEAKTLDWRLKLAGWLLAALLGVSGYLLINGSPMVQ